MAVSPPDLSPIEKAFRKNFIPFQVIGKVKKGPVRVLRIDQNGRKELKPFAQDEILKIYG
jgi:hypothetical protein